MSDHPDLEKLDPSVRVIVREVFRDPANGTPDNISKVGCWELAAHGFEVWNAWRAIFPVRVYLDHAVKNAVRFELAQTSSFTSPSKEALSFKSFVFGSHVKFIGDKKCLLHANFENATFGENSVFLNICFAPWANFVGAQFEGKVLFLGCIFSQFADFTACQTLGNMGFSKVTFCEGSRFWGAQIGKALQFDTVTFEGAASFKSQKWEQIANYCENLNSLKKWGDKYGLAPDLFYEITFRGCTFNGDVDFSDRTFLGKLAFDGNSEKQLNRFNFSPPLFFQVQLHQNTSFSNVIFPVPSGSAKASKAYGALKLAFSKQLASREEQRFFRLEMAEDAMAAQGWKRKLYAAYSFFSDYGFSVWLPIKRLVLIPALFSLAFYYFLLAFKTPALETQALIEFPVLAVQLFQFTLTNAMPIPGIDLGKDLRTALFDANSVSGSVALLFEMIQKAMVLTAYFLAGLALRNLFKLK